MISLLDSMLVFSFSLFIFFLAWGYCESGFFEFFIDRLGLVGGETLVMFDSVSIICLVMLFFCGSIALVFCGHYFGSGVLDGILLFRVLLIFLFVMSLLLVSFSVLSTLVMWEYLGVVSFFLILFYSNLDSLRATFITLFASRFGDVCLFGLVVIVMSYIKAPLWLFTLLVFLVVCTKSACFPFVSWLLEAMRAPTPVSSLVHSSTLVAAGVWFLFRYGSNDFFIPVSLEFFFCVVCLSTILISSFCSVVFFDLKKIVALSTCNNISWCILFFLFGNIYLGLFQLLSHGVAKCYLFMGLGDLMSSSSSAQDSRGVFSSGYSGVFSLVFQSLLVLSLSGLPFLGIFFSKHALLSDLLWSYSFSCYFLLFLSFLLSCAYSFRFLFLLSGFSSLGVSSYGSLFIFIFMSCLISGVLNLLCVEGSGELLSVSLQSSILLLFVQVVGCCLGAVLYYYPTPENFVYYGLVIWGCDGVVGFFYKARGWFYSIFSFLLYRWELCVASHPLQHSFVNGYVTSLRWLSLKFLILGLFCILVLSFVFC